LTTIPPSQGRVHASASRRDQGARADASSLSIAARNKDAEGGAIVLIQDAVGPSARRWESQCDV
jgi:hypothetical protein